MPDEIITYHYENEALQQLQAEKLERIAALESLNEIRTVILIIWGILLLAGMIFFAVKLASHIKKLALASDKKVTLTCEKCGIDFELPIGYFTENPLIPQKSVNVSVPGIGMTVKHSRKLTCPVCNEESWCTSDQSLNAPKSLEIFFEALKKCIPFLIIELVIFVSGGVAFVILDAIKKTL